MAKLCNLYVEFVLNLGWEDLGSWYLCNPYCWDGMKKLVLV